MTFIAADFVNTDSSMVTSPFKAVIFVGFTNNSRSSLRAGAFKVIYEIIASSTMLAWVRVTVIDVVLTVFTLETPRALALISANHIFACGSVLAWIGGTLIYFLLAVAAVIALCTDTLVTVPCVPAVSAILAELVRGYFLKPGSCLTRYLSNIAYFSCPSIITITTERGTLW